MNVICEVIGYQYIYKPESRCYYVIQKGKSKIPFCNENPLAVWDYFIGAVDMAMRRRMGSALEKQGLNRWTGLPIDERE